MQKLIQFPGVDGVSFIADRFTLQQFREYASHVDDYDFWDRMINGGDTVNWREHERVKTHYIGYSFSMAQKAAIPIYERHRYSKPFCTGRILDVGSFTGIFLSHLLMSGYDAIGVDMGDNVISVCREHLRIIGMDESRVVKGLFHAMPFPEGHFDTVICQEGFEHFFSPPLLMHEIRRVLQPGGGFTGSTPHRNAVDDPLHIVYFEEYGMRNLLETAGFEVVDLRIGPSCFATDEPTQILWKARKKT